MCSPSNVPYTDSEVRRFALAEIALGVALGVALAGLAALLVGVAIAGVGRAARWVMHD